MRSRRNGKNSIDIDLTSMLDVIFIILMVVMCSVSVGSLSAEDIQAKLDETEAKLEQTEGQLDMYEAMVEIQENLPAKVAIMTVRADYEKEDPTTRHIQILRMSKEGDDKPQIEEITIKPETEDEAFGALELKITELINEDPSIPVLLSINEEQILYRDHLMLEEMLTRMQEEQRNLYVQSGATDDDI